MVGGWYLKLYDITAVQAWVLQLYCLASSQQVHTCMLTIWKLGLPVYIYLHAHSHCALPSAALFTYTPSSLTTILIFYMHCKKTCNSALFNSFLKKRKKCISRHDKTLSQLCGLSKRLDKCQRFMAYQPLQLETWL